MATVARRLSVQMAQLPVLVRRTLTWDRGMELAGHKEVTAATGLAVYFADPRSPWQRGTNENTNRLLRQYLPKGVSMAGLTQDDLDQIAARLNTRPRMGGGVGGRVPRSDAGARSGRRTLAPPTDHPAPARPGAGWSRWVRRWSGGRRPGSGRPWPAWCGPGSGERRPAATVATVGAPAAASRRPPPRSAAAPRRGCRRTWPRRRG
jgi:hypothetical protein